MHTIQPIAAFNDNYIWMIVHPEQRLAVVVDPGDAEPVLEALNAHQVELAAIMITHHHWDHTNGIAGLLEKYSSPVYGPAHDPVELCDHPLEDRQRFTLPEMELSFTAMAIPGHTLGHIGLYGQGWLFSGDTLFTGGCGKLFEGTAEQMWHSLSQMMTLPDETLIYCGHEYTQSNLKFALKVEPDSPDLLQRIEKTNQLRGHHEPTVPSTLALEKATNPFLRCEQPSVIQAAETHAQSSLESPDQVFATLRTWKDLG